MSGSGSHLQRELKQNKPFRSVRQEAALSLLRTADLLRRHISRALAPWGITPQQYNILRILRGAGSEGLPTLAIGERLIEQTPGMTRLLDRLEAKRLVRRERCPQDRRQVLCYVTGEGLQLLSEVDPLVASAEYNLLGGVTDEESRALVRMLERIRSGLDD